MNENAPTVKVVPGFDPKLPIAGGPKSLESKVKITHHVLAGTVVPTPQEILDAATERKHHHRTKRELHKKEEKKKTASVFGGKIGEPVVELIPQCGDILNGEIVQ